VCSRQPRRPGPQHAWVSAITRAVNELDRKQDLNWQCSVGTPGYDLALTLLAPLPAHKTIFVPASWSLARGLAEPELRALLVREYALSANTFDIQIVSGPNGSDEVTRDNIIVERADLIYPISIRPKGTFELILAKEKHQGKIPYDYKVPWDNKHSSIKFDFSQRRISEATANTINGRLLHFTRSPNGPWPGERICDYWRQIGDGAGAPRDARATLTRILNERMLRASSTHMPFGAAMVAFSSAPLSDCVSLMRYRARYNFMAFEPWGVAFPHELAKSFDIRPVRYLTSSELSQETHEERLYAQSAGERGLWSREAEWRHAGAFSLAPVWPDIMALTETESAAREIEKQFGLRVLPVFDET